ncbi:MAG TPA: hypothetical protein PKK40_12345 [Marmoricola sp.]|nr:hypothetical protein [Marmoricola sp.]
MGEKGNITSEELAAAGAGAVSVTTVISDTADTLKDKVIDKTADASIEAAKEKWQARHQGDSQDG